MIKRKIIKMNFELIALFYIFNSLFGVALGQNDPKGRKDIAKELEAKGIKKCVASSKLPLALEASHCDGTCNVKVGHNVSMKIDIIPGACASLTMRAQYSSALTGNNFLPVAPGPIDLCTQGVKCPILPGQTVSIQKNEQVMPLVVTKMEFQLLVRLCCESVPGWQAALGPNCSFPNDEVMCVKLKLQVDPAEMPKMPAFQPLPPATFPGFPAPGGTEVRSFPAQPAFQGFPGFPAPAPAPAFQGFPGFPANPQPAMPPIQGFPANQPIPPQG